MRVDVRDKKGINVCYIAGEVCLDTVPELKNVFKRMINGGVKNVILNFAKVEYIDSLGLAALIEFLGQLKRSAGRMVISDVDPKVSSIFRITKVDNSFEMYESEQEALETF